jgi:hypothetical protein
MARLVIEECLGLAQQALRGGKQQGRTFWTTLHLPHERAVTTLLRIPYDVMEAAFLPAVHTFGHEFSPGPRKPLKTIVHWDQW